MEYYSEATIKKNCDVTIIHKVVSKMMMLIVIRRTCEYAPIFRCTRHQVVPAAPYHLPHIYYIVLNGFTIITYCSTIIVGQRAP